MRFPSTDIEFAMQDEIDQLNATVHYFKLQLETAKARVAELEAALQKVHQAFLKYDDAEIGDIVRAAIRGESCDDEQT